MVYSKRVSSISKTARILGLITFVVLWLNAILVTLFLAKVKEGNLGLPNWAQWSSGITCSIIAVMLLSTLMVLIRTFNLYVKGRLKRDTLWIRKYFTLFSLSYTFLAFLLVSAYIMKWNLTSNFLHWPMLLQSGEFLLEFVFDILAIGYLVRIHHRNFKPKPLD